ncbi:MAG: hypothetical protein AB7P40_04065, partial [Chloroflexota bacterium]
LARAHAALGKHEEAVATIREGLSKVDPSGQFAPPAEKLPETAAVRATEIKRSERATLLGVMAESLIRLGRASEALPAIEEAVDASPKDRWLAATREEAVAVANGAPPNLVLNPGFDRSGSWALRTAEWWMRPLPRTLLNEQPPIGDGASNLAVTDADARRLLVQEVLELEPGQRYRLTARIRAERLTGGAVRVSLASLRTTHEAMRLVQPQEALSWTTVSVEAEAGPAPDNNLTIVIGFTPDTPAGAAMLVDTVSLTRIGAQTASR